MNFIKINVDLSNPFMFFEDGWWDLFVTTSQRNWASMRKSLKVLDRTTPVYTPTLPYRYLGTFEHMVGYFDYYLRSTIKDGCISVCVVSMDGRGDVSEQFIFKVGAHIEDGALNHLVAITPTPRRGNDWGSTYGASRWEFSPEGYLRVSQNDANAVCCRLTAAGHLAWVRKESGYYTVRYDGVQPFSVPIPEMDSPFLSPPMSQETYLTRLIEAGKVPIDLEGGLTGVV